MSEPDRPPRTNDLLRRVKAAKERRAGRLRKRSPAASYASSGMGVGIRVGVDLVAGVGVGAAIGWGLDWWLGTGPWLLAIFLIFGFAAGLMNVIRTANQSSKTPPIDSPDR